MKKKKEKKIKPTPRLKFSRKTGTRVHEDQKKKIHRKRKYKKKEIDKELESKEEKN